MKELFVERLGMAGGGEADGIPFDVLHHTAYSLFTQVETRVINLQTGSPKGFTNQRSDWLLTLEDRASCWLVYRLF